MIRVQLTDLGKEIPCPKNRAVRDLLVHYPGDADKVLAVRINHEVKDLNTLLTEDASVEFLDVSTIDGNRIYQRTLSMVLVVAVKELFLQDGDVSVEHSLDGGLYCKLSINQEVDAQIVAR